jgi:hypothetical protein
VTLEAAVDSMERVDGLEGPYPDLLDVLDVAWPEAARGIHFGMGKAKSIPSIALDGFRAVLGGSAIGRDWQAWALADPGPLLAHHRALAHDRTAHAAADLRGVHIQLGEGAA